MVLAGREVFATHPEGSIPLHFRPYGGVCTLRSLIAQPAKSAPHFMETDALPDDQPPVPQVARSAKIPYGSALRPNKGAGLARRRLSRGFQFFRHIAKRLALMKERLENKELEQPPKIRRLNVVPAEMAGLGAYRERGEQQGK